MFNSNKFQLPSNSANLLFPNKFESKTVENKRPQEIPVQTIIPDPKTMIIQEQKNVNAEFEQLVRDKLGKIDDILIALQEKQNTIMQPVQIQSVQREPETEKRGTRSKKTYYNITDTMWGDIKERFKELPDSYREKTYSDGTDFYAELKGKKIKLDARGLLKILNSK